MVQIRLGPAVTSAGPDDVVSRLRDCHDRIRVFVREALAIAESDASTTPERRRRSAENVLRYFTIALPLHEADEDASIAPRLRAAAGGSLDGLLERMEEHDRIDTLVGELMRDWQSIARDGALPDDLAVHRESVRHLGEIMEAHLGVEETELFPRIAALPARERRAIVREMADRRA